MTRSGGCQCGAVRFRADAVRDDAHVCHCRMCQKATGNLFAALVGVAARDLHWTRGAPAYFQSSDQVERGFCAACGTPLVFHVLPDEAGQAHWALSIGAFDDPASLPLVSEDGPEGRLPQVDQLGQIPIKPPTEVELGEEAITGSRQHPDNDT